MARMGGFRDQGYPRARDRQHLHDPPHQAFQDRLDRGVGDHRLRELAENYRKLSLAGHNALRPEANREVRAESCRDYGTAGTLSNTVTNEGEPDSRPIRSCGR